MPAKNASVLADVPLRNLKHGEASGEGSLRKCSDAGHVVARALERAGIPRKDAACQMGISDSLLTRQLNGTEHLSWQRLNLLPVAFKRELVVAIAEAMDDSGVVIRTTVELRSRKAG